MAEELLHRADVVAALDEVGRERMPQTVAARLFHDARGAAGALDRALQDGFVEVMAATFAARALCVSSRCREYPLPAPVAGSGGILSGEGIGELHVAGSFPDVLLELPARSLEVLRQQLQQSGGEQGGPVFCPLASRTRISRRSRSMSFTRRRQHSMRRSPDP